MLVGYREENRELRWISKLKHKETLPQKCLEILVKIVASNFHEKPKGWFPHWFR